MYWGEKEKEKKKKKKKSNRLDDHSSGSSVDESDGNRIYFYSRVDRSSILELIKKLHLKEAEMQRMAMELSIPAPPIMLHINSFGGSIFDGLAAVDTITSLKVPVHSIVEGGAASAATLMSVACHERLIRPTSFMLIHQMSSMSWGKYEELKDDMKNNELLMETIYGVYQKYAKIPKVKLTEMLKHDLWFKAADCLKYGLVDRIV